MWQSLRISNLILRLSLAGVFLWFGIDKFFHPIYWINAWTPDFFINLIATLNISTHTLMYSVGVIELLVGISLVSNMFVDFFALIAIVFLISVSLFHGFNEVLVRDIGIIGGLLSLVFWPHPRYH
ncbi:MAG: DoxX family membrane protein [Candidatus Curtissbacteria bacterium]|nr:DoxX family membrane protein [Candidatus Curtissbacteria bacterium]